MPRYLNKRCIRLPGCEIQISRRSGAVVVWFRCRKYTLRKPRTI
jgi:hypothetical protein